MSCGVLGNGRELFVIRSSGVPDRGAETFWARERERGSEKERTKERECEKTERERAREILKPIPFLMASSPVLLGRPEHWTLRGLGVRPSKALGSCIARRRRRKAREREIETERTKERAILDQVSILFLAFGSKGGAWLRRGPVGGLFLWEA